MNLSVDYYAPPTLSEFMESDKFVRAVMGPIGSGKSSGCVVEILRRAAEQKRGPDGIRHTRFAVIRNTYPELRDTTVKTFEQWIPDALGKWHGEEFTFEMRFNDIHCEVLFRALDTHKDVKKVLSLELTGAYINELREISPYIFDALQGRTGRYPAKKDGGATWFGVWADTNPWPKGHRFQKLFASNPAGHQLFKQPGGRSPEAENIENLPPGYYERLAAGKDAEWIQVYIDGEEASSDVGSIYGALLDKLEERGGLALFEHPTDGIFVNFDLGVSDSTAMFWWRFNKHGMPDIVDWYEASGQGASHFFEVLRGGMPQGCDRARKYRVSKIWLPHDARQRTFQTGVSTLELFLKEFPGVVAISPELDIDGGIQAGRWLLEQPMRIHPRCTDAIERLRAYKYVWDEEKKVFSKKPLHDWASHTADCFRYVACVVRAAWHETHKPEPPTIPAINPRGPTVDELFAEVRGSRKSNRI